MLFLFRICFGVSLFIQASSAWAHSCSEELQSLSSEMSFISSSAPSLETKRLLLTSRLRPEEIPQLNRLLGIADIRASFESEDWLQEFMKKASEGPLHYKDLGFRTMSFFLFSKTNGELIGSVGLFEFDANHSISVSYFLDPQFRGQDLIRETLETLISLIESRTGPRSFFAWIRADNIASRKLAESLGFVSEMQEGPDLFYQRRFAGLEKLKGP